MEALKERLQLNAGPLDAVFRAVLLVVLLYVFLVAIALIGESFKLIGGGAVTDIFGAVGHPITALLVGMLATAVLQSSSTTTSIIVGLVAAGVLDIGTAIPMVMGANIGTSVTNTLVSMGQAGNRLEFGKAFSAATVHDLFNVLAVVILLPLELATGFIQKLSALVTGLLVGTSSGSFRSPLAAIIKPAVKFVVSVDKAKLTAAAGGEQLQGSLLKGGLVADVGLADATVGVAVLVGAAVVLVLALLGLVKLMKAMMQDRAAGWLRRGLEKNGYVSMGIGAGATAAVQSSSITTSTMVPMVGSGFISLEAVFPLTLGANVGTTVTALIASLGASGEHAVLGLQIAVCHLLFNVIGILIWYPIPFMRRIPLAGARLLGEAVSKRRWLAAVYVALVFFLGPFAVLLADKAINGPNG